MMKHEWNWIGCVGTPVSRMQDRPLISQQRSSDGEVDDEDTGQHARAKMHPENYSSHPLYTSAHCRNKLW